MNYNYAMWIIIIILIVLSIILIITAVSRKNRYDRSDNYFHNEHHDRTNYQIKNDKYASQGLSKQEISGRIGEDLVNNRLSDLLNKNGYLLENILIKRTHAEIDAVLISPKGVFCIEIKNWIGHIEGDAEVEEWKQILNNGKVIYHRNPVKQNEAHCVALNRLLENQYAIYNVVLFVNFESKDVDSIDVYTLNDFAEFYLSLDSNELDESDVNDVYNILRQYKATRDELEQYKKQIQSRYKN